MTTADLTPAEAAEFITTASWTQIDPDERPTCGHSGCTDHAVRRQRIHTVSAHGFGADWDLDEALAFVEASRTRVWTEHISSHELVVVGPDGRVIRFQVRKPEATA